MNWKKLLLAGVILGGLVVVIFHTTQVRATNVTIDKNLSVTPSIISFATVFPGEVNFRPLDINLSSTFLNDQYRDDVEYHISQLVMPKIISDDDYCQSNPTDYTRCYPSLCPYLSKEADGTPGNDTGVAAFHDPLLPTSIALGRLAKSDNDTTDNWVIDLHTPCFVGECDQTQDTPPEYQLDPSLNGEKFGCNLQIIVDKISCVDGSEVVLPQPPPSPVAPPCANPNPEGDLTGVITSRANGTATVTNKSNTCSYLVGYASYKEVDTNIDHQIYFSSDMKVIGPDGTISLAIDVPTCAYQQDLFYGNLIESFAGGIRYGTRKLSSNHNESKGFCPAICAPQLVTRTQGFWKTHTSFTSNVFANQLGGSMTVGTGGHVRTITNSTGNGNSRLFGAYYSSISKKTNNQNRSALDKARMRLLRQLVTAKINCAAFTCAPAIQIMITSADQAYATGTSSQILNYAGQLDNYNNSGNGGTIPAALGPVGSSTPATSQARANKVFWNTP